MGALAAEIPDGTVGETEKVSETVQENALAPESDEAPETGNSKSIDESEVPVSSDESGETDPESSDDVPRTLRQTDDATKKAGSAEDSGAVQDKPDTGDSDVKTDAETATETKNDTKTSDNAQENSIPKDMIIMPSPHKLNVNGAEVHPQAYLINRKNYFKLRDVAFIMSDTSAHFNVTWEAEKGAVNLISNQEYTEVGGEMAESTVNSIKVKPSTAVVLLNGNEVKLTGYLINGNNYYGIAEIGEAIGFPVSYDSDTKTVHISTDETPENPDTKPVDPQEPGDPGSVIEPGNDGTTTPTPPTTPTTPTDTTTPTTPTDTTTPTTPTDPTTPTTPTDPTTPATPTTPVAPSTDPTFTSGIYQVKVSSFLIVRSGPGTEYEDVKHLDNGEFVIVDSVSSEWAHIKNGSYCNMQFLTRTSDYPPKPYIPPRTKQLDGKKTVIIDAGHGGTDRGAINEKLDLDEKHVNLSVAQYLKGYLEEAGVNVIMVRDDLEEGAKLALRKETMEQNLDVVDLFFSVHHNASDTKARGAMILCQIADEDGGPTSILAKELNTEYEKLGLEIRKPWYRLGMSGDYYYVNRHAAGYRIPAVISEFCFIDNEEDVKFIDTDEELMVEAQAQCNAILRYFEQTQY